MPVTDEVPKKFDLKKVKVTPVTDDAPAKFDLSKVKVVGDQDFTVNPKREGTYKMVAPSYGGAIKLVDVPYSRVQDAFSAGYTLGKSGDSKRYAEDKFTELNKNGDKPNSNINYAGVTPTPARGSKEWWKETGVSATHKGLGLLPTVGGIVGGILGGGAGLETGPGAIVTGAVGAAAGSGLGESIRQEAEERLFPDQTKLTPAETARGIAVQAGLGGVSEGLGRASSYYVFRPAIKALGETAEASRKAGFRMLPSEASGKAPSIFETYPKASILSRGRMASWREAQNKETESAAQKLADSLSNSKGTPEQLGQKVQDGIAEHTKQFRTIQNKMYDDIGKQVNERTVKVPITSTKQVPTGLLDEYGKPTFTTSQTTKLVEQVVDDVMPSTVKLKQFAADELKKLGQVEKVLDPNLLSQSRSMLQTLAEAPDNMPYSAMRAARSDTLAKVRELDQAMAGKQAGLAKKMAGLFDDSIMDAVQKSKIPGLEQQVRAADAFTANEHKMFEQALIKKVVDTKKPELISALVRGKTIGNEELRDLFTVIPKNLHAPVQKQVIMDAISQATNNLGEAFNEVKFSNAIRTIGDDRGNIIFGQNWKNIKEFSELMGRITEKTGLQAASLSNPEIAKEAAKQVGRMILETVLGGASGHAAGQTLAGAAIPLMSEAALWNAAATALIHPAGAAKVLNGLRLMAKGIPYAATATMNETGGYQKGINRIKEAAKNLQTKPSPPPSIPQGATHYYDASSGTIVPIQ